ncbi:PRC-barrel domain containing protein [Streptacidiphilus pinicola]|uniref:PRC-barrel domain containing protein n=1 Tax=Streptacidiphilus pinicola TaxID=2219663 RepID=A0A2X0K8P3_9ACTN|nr:PRC-barrel domain containing protein [Streptacidiphilus pinicola]RAG85655.1 PRC-barrel domain containing protein [Streptacidiphilus pinicola]
MTTRLWGYRDEVGYTDDLDLIGFHVEALDGRIGHVIHASSGGSTGCYLVVDTGPWIFGKHAVLPARAVSRIDATRRTIVVDRTRQEIKDAPEPGQLLRHPETGDLHRLGGYYSKFYADGKV